MATITATTPTSELDAINTMLEAIGESPVVEADLTSTTLVYVVVAKRILTQVNREVQSTGWHFNTETEYPLTRNVDDQIILPANCLRIDTSKIQNDINVTARGAYLYDIKNRVYTFEQDLKADLTLLLPFCNLPEAARFYISVRAARRFHDRVLTSEHIHMYTQQDEMAALAILQDAEGDTADYNMLSDSYSVSNILERW